MPLLTILCPHCDNVVNIFDDPFETIIDECPECGEEWSKEIQGELQSKVEDMKGELYE